MAPLSSNWDSADGDGMRLEILPIQVVRAGFLIALAALAGCVEWRPFTPLPINEPLPHYVRVTARDAGQQTLEHAAFCGDTLVGWAYPRGRTEVHIPVATITHFEARVPSLPRSAAVGGVVIVGILVMVYAINQASP